MNSPDPWRIMRSSPPAARMVVPAPYYRRDGLNVRSLFESVGAEAPTPTARRTGLTAEVAPVVAPATGGITTRVELDAKQRLHVAICVDGKCYESSMDLAPAITAVMTKFAQYHADLHRAARPPLVSGDIAVCGAVDSAVGEAADALIGQMIGRHVDVACGGWLSDIGGAVKSAARGVARAPRRVASTLGRLKGPIGAAASIAAASAASSIPGVGPIAAPIAGKLANDLVQSAAGDKAAEKRVAQATKQAKVDPIIAAALGAAEKAAATSTVAHHVQDTATKAVQGQSSAQQEIAKVAEDAEQGDPAAKIAADLVAQAMKSEWGAKLWERATGRGPAVSGWPWHTIVGVLPWYTIVGAAVDDLRKRAASLAAKKRGDVIGVVRTSDGLWHSLAFGSSDDADDWLGIATRDPSAYVYAAYFDKGGFLFPRPENEKLGGVRAPSVPGAPIPRGAAEAR